MAESSADGGRPALAMRRLALAPGGCEPLPERGWSDALVVVTLGRVDVVCRSGVWRRFGRGSMLAFAGLDVCLLANGSDTDRAAVVALTAVRRRSPRPSPGSGDPSPAR